MSAELEAGDVLELMALERERSPPRERRIADVASVRVRHTGDRAGGAT